MDEGKGQETFRFRRPWESPPREENEVPVVPIPIKTEVPGVQNNWSESEEVEVFRFDREKLVLITEKVRVKRESEDTTNPPSLSLSIEGHSSRSSKCLLSKESSSSSSTSCIDTESEPSDSDSSEQSESSFHTKNKVTDLRPSNYRVEPDDTFDEALERDYGMKDYDSNSNDDEFDEPDVKVRLEDFTEGRNRERKNSKWADYGVTRKSSRLLSTRAKFCNKAHKAQVLKKLTSLLKKGPEDLTEDDKMNLTAFPDIAAEARKRLEKRQLASERMKEEEDPEDVLDKKCARLAQVVSRAKYLVVFTGAGISTSASIPDYRGPNGIWTLLRKGQAPSEDLKQFPQSADPTITHMAIKELYDRDVVKHIVSQNVDGLHLRSGIPKTALSEVHGNMYIEVCLECHREYVRLFDVTENTRRHHHKTGRFCYHCGSALKDSVVLFGEKGSLRWPINWAGAEYNVDKADVILCLGSSLKVLRRYPWLWCMSKPAKQRPKLYIVNLQWTPKDRFAVLKINGRCDAVISKVMDNLQIPIPPYERMQDSIFSIATQLHPSEDASKVSQDLSLPAGFSNPEKSTDLRNYFKFDPVFCKEVRALNQVKRKVVDGEVSQEEPSGVNAKSKSSCGIGWLGNVVSIKPKKKKVK